MTSPAALRSIQLAVPRCGNSPDEYEDATGVNPALGRCAIADGATESSYARRWAELLVDEFASSEENLHDWGWLTQARTRWQAEVGSVELPWYAEAKRAEGAFAAFLGVTVTDGRWQCLAVGDSCLFHIHADSLSRAWPLNQSRQFTSTPWLLGSRPENTALRDRKVQLAEGELLSGDRLWLLTDALAQWFLESVEQGRQPWQVLESFLSDLGQHLFEDWIQQQRADRALRNDDVTLLAVWLE